jgi:hypothetical protein
MHPPQELLTADKWANRIRIYINHTVQIIANRQYLPGGDGLQADRFDCSVTDCSHGPQIDGFRILGLVVHA